MKKFVKSNETKNPIHKNDLIYKLLYNLFSGSSDPNPGLEFDNAGGASSDQQMIPNISSGENNLHHSDHHIQDQDDHHGSHQFCNAYKDTALLDNSKVLKNMLDLEEFYLPDISIYEDIQDEIQIHMRKIVTEWMLDVCIGIQKLTIIFTKKKYLEKNTNQFHEKI